MIVGATLSLHSSLNSVPPTFCPSGMAGQNSASLLQRPPQCFNKIQALFSALVSADPLLSTLSKLTLFQIWGMGGMCSKKNHPGFDAISSRFGGSRCARFTVAPRQSGTPCAAMAASVHRLCGPAKGWNSRLGYWPRPHASSSSWQTLSRPPPSGHCF